MSAIISALIIIFILGVLIVSHEFGHFWAARRRGVRVLEFAIGMGPKLFSRQKQLPDGTMDTKFSLRLLPIGGFCSMEGEDADSSDPKAFGNASVLSRFLILSAGSVMNLLVGLLLCLIFVIPVDYVPIPVIQTVEPASTLAPYIQPGDEIISINGHLILRYENVLMFLNLGRDRPYSMVIERGGERISYTDMPVGTRDFGDDGGIRYGFSCGYRENTVPDKLLYAINYAADNCRLVWVSLGELVLGNAGLSDLMGPVGLGGAVNSVVTAEITLLDRVWSILSLTILITLNLAVMNLLPLPALDGGRLVFLLIEAIRRKPVPAKIEGAIHSAAMLCLFALMLLVMFNDIMRLIGGGGA